MVSLDGVVVLICQKSTCDKTTFYIKRGMLKWKMNI